ncbi:hypothetical protein [Intestinibacter sp.]|uniref:hypothetical protein n=1 Tax=Intestinibacter sp. TaxID=1965304 RepID=UPI003F171005
MKKLISLIKWFIERILSIYEPLQEYLLDVFRKNIQIPLYKKLNKPIEPKILTESHFNKSFLNKLKSISKEQLDIKVPNWKDKVNNGEAVIISVIGSDYSDNYGTVIGFSPKKQIEFVLGGFYVTATKSYILCTDKYDFSSNNRIIKNLNTKESDPDNEKIHIRIKMKIG